MDSRDWHSSPFAASFLMRSFESALNEQQEDDSEGLIDTDFLLSVLSSTLTKELARMPDDGTSVCVSGDVNVLNVDGLRDRVEFATSSSSSSSSQHQGCEVVEILHNQKIFEISDAHVKMIIDKKNLEKKRKKGCMYS